MLLLTFLKPGFTSEKNKMDLVNDYLNHDNKINVGFDCEVNYGREEAAEHYSHVPEQFKKDTIDYIVSEPVYGYIFEYCDSEQAWHDDRLRIFGATKEKDLQPNSFRYQKTIGQGKPYVVGRNVVHSSDSYQAANKEMMIFLDLVKDACMQAFENGEVEKGAKIFQKLRKFCDDCSFKKNEFLNDDLSGCSDEYKNEIENIVNQYCLVENKINEITEDLIDEKISGARVND